jgi:tyrosinase
MEIWQIASIVIVLSIIWFINKDHTKRPIRNERTPYDHLDYGGASSGSDRSDQVYKPKDGPIYISRYVRARKNAKQMTDVEKKKFIHTLQALKSKRSTWYSHISVYDMLVSWYKEAFEDTLRLGTNIHASPLFLPWHRYYLSIFEEEMQKINPDVSIPYWNFCEDRDEHGFPWTDDFLGGTGDVDRDGAIDTGAFAVNKWTIDLWPNDDPLRLTHIVRNIGDIENISLPTEEQYRKAMQVPYYDTEPWNQLSNPKYSFRNYVEGFRNCRRDQNGDIECDGPLTMHNAVNLWVGGYTPHRLDETIQIPGTILTSVAPYDPVFLLIYCNIDRLWAEWEIRHGYIYAPVNSGPKGYNLTDKMFPWDAAPSDVLDWRNLGYDYDTTLGINLRVK